MQSFRAFTGIVVYQADPVLGQLVQIFLQSFGSEGNVMYAFTLFFQEFAYGTLGSVLSSNSTFVCPTLKKAVRTF
jgi:hypothetical protein